MIKGDTVLVSGNGMYCRARMEQVPTEGPRAALGHVMVSCPAEQGVTRYAPGGRANYWVEKKYCKVVAKDPA